MCSASGHVRFTPKCDIKCDRLEYPPWASSGHAHLFDHLVRTRLQCRRHAQAERLGGLEVDHQFELDRGLDGKSARLFALEDAVDIGCRAPIRIELVSSVGQQAAELSEGSARIDGREAGASCQRYDLGTMYVREGVRHHDQAA